VSLFDPDGLFGFRLGEYHLPSVGENGIELDLFGDGLEKEKQESNGE